jgi:hypothetical protein
MEYLGAWGTLIHEKNLKSKILCQTPFNWKLPYAAWDGSFIESEKSWLFKVYTVFQSFELLNFIWTTRWPDLAIL